jgi:hypothetical protein
VTAGARWEERVVTLEMLLDLGTPPRIALLARDLQRAMIGSTLILGELLREEVMLDPYLLLETGGERICLGIWEDRRVITAAI